jgi:hypothetical protein
MGVGRSPTGNAESAERTIGSYRRRIRLVSVDDRTVRGDLEDDFHRFGLTLHHDGARVTAVEGDAERFPWTTCPSAVEPLRAVAGAPISRRLTELGEHVAARSNCTHLFDLAGLAIAHAARAVPQGRRQYDAMIPDRSGMSTSPQLERDGELVLRWQLEGTTLAGPPPYEGLALRAGFLAWAEANLDEEEAEAAIVLRRACDISFGRAMDLDVYESGADLGDIMLGTCHSFQPGTIEVGLRNKGQTRDFSDDADRLLQG